MSNIVGLGVTVVDLLALIDEYPQVDTKQDVETAIIQVGGPVPTALAQLAKFGHHCRLLSLWGDDPFGDVIEADLRRKGIAFDERCRWSAATTGHSQVWVERATGRRTSVTQRPAAEAMMLSEADHQTLQHADLLHLDGWPCAVALNAAEIVKAHGGRVVIDTGSPKPGIDQLIPLADAVNAPRRFIESHLRETDLAQGAAAIARMGPTVVTVTDGERGAVLWSNGRCRQVDPLPISPVVDTNGAGDVFSAGLIHGLLNEWDADAILRFATAAAGLKCTGWGNRHPLANLKDVNRHAELLTTRATPLNNRAQFWGAS